MSDYKLHFDECFKTPANVRKLEKMAELLPATYVAMNELTRWRHGRWPSRIHCMSRERIIEGRSRGAGHGYTYVGDNDIWLNPHMTWQGYWIVLVHESMHHAFPDATEDEINNKLVPEIVERVLGHKKSAAWYRKHGLGPPEPGIGDRGYVY